MWVFNRKNAARFFTTFADVGSLFMALVYITYVALLLLLNIGYDVINYCMLGITILYVSFFIFKIFYLNRINPTAKTKRKIKFAYRYTKFSMKFINAAFVVISIINIGFGENHVIPLIGIIVLVTSFGISIFWEISRRIIKRQILEMRAAWMALEESERKDKIEFVIDYLVRQLDSINGIDNYVGYGLKAGRKVGYRFRLTRSETSDVSNSKALKDSQTDLRDTVVKTSKNAEYSKRKQITKEDSNDDDLD